MIPLDLRRGAGFVAVCGALLATLAAGNAPAAVMLADVAALVARSDARRL